VIAAKREAVRVRRATGARAMLSQTAMPPSPPPSRLAGMVSRAAARLALVTGLTGLLAAAVLAACVAEPEPAFGQPSAIEGKVVPGLEGTTAATPKGDGGAPAKAAKLFEGETDPAPPAKSAAQSHAGKPGTPGMAPSLACALAGCHGPNHAGPEWAISGYVEKAGKPAAGAVVAAVTASGKRFAAVADADGYFWAPGPLVTDGKAGARGGTTGPALMAGALPSDAGGNCNKSGCHQPSTSPGGGAGYIRVN
jgi:hypothetical protein